MKLVFPTTENFTTYIDDISQLYFKCYHHIATEEYFTWKYLKNPINELYVALAYDDSELAAFYAVSPITCTNNGKMYKAALSLNTMTAPEYSGKGLFQKLAKIVYENLKRSGYKFVIGFPNSISNHIFAERLGFETLYEIPMLEKKVSGFIDNIDEKFKGQKKMIEDSSFLLNYEEIFKIQGEFKIECKKNKEYLLWRYSKSPENHYLTFALESQRSVKAYGICKAYGDKLNVVEQHALSNELRKVLFYNIERYALENKYNYVTTWAPVCSEEHWILEKMGYINRYPIHYFIAKWLSDQEEPKDFNDYRRWLIQLGDNNTY